jgi:hypothetical protein
VVAELVGTGAGVTVADESSPLNPNPPQPAVTTTVMTSSCHPIFLVML